MFNKIKICKAKIDCRGDYYTLRTKIEELIAEKDSFLKNSQLECLRYTEGGFINLNLTYLAAFFTAIGFANKKELDANTMGLIFGASLICFFLIGWWCVKMNEKKINARKILFILNDIEKEQALKKQNKRQGGEPSCQEKEVQSAIWHISFGLTRRKKRN